MPFHGGVYGSGDAGESWIDIGQSLPSDFGFPVVTVPRDPDAAWVIPMNSDRDQVTTDGRVRVFETRDAGATWSARESGLPADGYLTILRQAFCHDGGDLLGLYFGATSSEVFASAGAGATWSLIARDLPALSIRAS